MYTQWQKTFMVWNQAPDSTTGTQKIVKRKFKKVLKFIEAQFLPCLNPTAWLTTGTERWRIEDDDENVHPSFAR